VAAKVTEARWQGAVKALRLAIADAQHQLANHPEAPYQATEQHLRAQMTGVAEAFNRLPIDRQAAVRSEFDQLRAQEAALTSSPGMTGEENFLLSKGLLPACWGAIKQAASHSSDPAQVLRATGDPHLSGLAGPFNEHYADPAAMLRTARHMLQHPDLRRMFGELRKGDLVLEATPRPDVVKQFTRGAYSHALICVETQPFPQFIEAIGITGGPNDHTSNRVRRTSFYSEIDDSHQYRVLRPSNDPAVIDRAIRFATSQLGKPYDYTFERLPLGAGKGPNSFYCSDLAYYSYRVGAGVDLPIRKDAGRDIKLLAVDHLLEALGADNVHLMKQRISQFLNTHGPQASDQQVAHFVATELLPHFDRLREVAATPNKQAKVERALTRIMSGQTQKGLTQALDGSGPPASSWAKALMEHVAGPPVMAGLYLAREFHEAGLSVTVAARLAATLGEVGLTHPSDLKGLLVPDDAGEVYAVKNAAPDRPSPDRRDTKQEFISPTDLAFAAVPHTDYTPRHLG
jgi:hypothetical protein